MNASHKFNQLKNRLKRLTHREFDKQNPLNPRQIERLKELRLQFNNK